MKRWTKEDTRTAASVAAGFWLRSAESIIARGERPARLSTSDDLIRDVISERCVAVGVTRVPFLTHSFVKDEAVSLARDILAAGRYPSVRRYFTRWNVQ